MLRPILLKLMGERKEGWGLKAPAFLLLNSWGRASRGYVLAGAGVAGTAVLVVSVLTWWNGLYTPVSRPIQEAVNRALPTVIVKVDQQVTQAASLLGVGEETLRSVVREGLAAVGSGATQPVRAVEDAAARSVSAAPVAQQLLALPTTGGGTSSTPEAGTSSNSPTPATISPRFSSPNATEDEEESTPSATSNLTPPSPPTTQTLPPPTTEQPSPPPNEETPSAEPTPPSAAGETPPPTGQPAPPSKEAPPTESPSPTTGEETPSTDSPPPKTSDPAPPPTPASPPPSSSPTLPPAPPVPAPPVLEGPPTTQWLTPPSPAPVQPPTK
jgi:hypothetical protein